MSGCIIRHETYISTYASPVFTVDDTGGWVVAVSESVSTEWVNALHIKFHAESDKWGLCLADLKNVINPADRHFIQKSKEWVVRNECADVIDQWSKKWFTSISVDYSLVWIKSQYPADVPRETWSCPCCLKPTYNMHDIAHSFCGYCYWFAADGYPCPTHQLQPVIAEQIQPKVKRRRFRLGD